MLISLSLIILVAMSLGAILKFFKAPSLIAFILTGILLGPFVLDFIDPSILSISADLRQIALVIILTRAGLSLDLDSLKKVGRPAFLLSFLPASFEILGFVILTPLLFPVSHLEAALLGSVIAAVSPAVVVPKMIRLKSEGYGNGKGIADMVLAGSSVDDVFVIVFFYSFLSLLLGGTLDAGVFLDIPVSIVTGFLLGFLVGTLYAYYYRKVHVRDSVKVIVLLSLSFLMVGGEAWVKSYIPISMLIAVMSASLALRYHRREVAVRLGLKYQKLWIFFEVLLFVLVGASVDPAYILSEGGLAILLIFLSLSFRMLGVFFSLLGTGLNSKERLFVALSYTPKATVQAAIGSIPLSYGLECGDLILTIAVLAILITAPLGAFMIDISYKRLLEKE